jgi:hypothetical protein
MTRVILTAVEGHVTLSLSPRVILSLSKDDHE